MLDISHVTKVFFPGTVNEKVALEDINLHIDEGDVVSVIGSNGSGKSTLFNMIAGTFPVTSGTITAPTCRSRTTCCSRSRRE